MELEFIHGRNVRVDSWENHVRFLRIIVEIKRKCFVFESESPVRVGRHLVQRALWIRKANDSLHIGSQIINEIN